MIAPPWLLAAGGSAALLIGLGAGWTVRDWKADADQLQAVEQARAREDEIRREHDRLAATHEKEKADALARSTARQGALREQWRDAPPVDCAAPAGVRGVLEQSVRDANARAAGEPAEPLPAASPAARPAG